MWKKSANSDSIKPLEIDDASSKKYVYIRRNFELVEVQPQEGADDGTGDENTETSYHWEYEENKIPKSDWETYRQVLDAQAATEQAQADILYLSMMTGVEL